MNSMDKIIIEVNKECTQGAFDCSNEGKGVTGVQVMYAACMLIDGLLEEGVFTLDEVLNIVKNIPNAQATSESLHNSLWT